MPILTTEEIRVLNDARTILEQAGRTIPRSGEGDADGYDYGRASAQAEQAADAIFQTLNVLNAYRVQAVPEDLMHNRETNPTRALGTIEEITIESDERGWELHFVSTDHGRFIANIHAVSEQLLAQVKPIEHYWEEAEAESGRELRTRDLADGYDLSDPKHPDYHSVHSDIWDARDNK